MAFYSDNPALAGLVGILIGLVVLLVDMLYTVEAPRDSILARHRERTFDLSYRHSLSYTSKLFELKIDPVNPKQSDKSIRVDYHKQKREL